MTRSMDAEERYYQKRMEYVKHCTHMRHGKHVKVDLSSTSSTENNRKNNIGAEATIEMSLRI